MLVLTVYENFIAVSDSILQLTFKKLPFVGTSLVAQ